MPGGVPVATITSTTVGVDGPPTFIIMGSENTIAQGLAIARIGDPVLPHVKYGSKRVHSRAVASGSPTVIVNGLAVAYEGSMITCGDLVSQSPAKTVLVGI